MGIGNEEGEDLEDNAGSGRGQNEINREQADLDELVRELTQSMDEL